MSDMTVAAQSQAVPEMSEIGRLVDELGRGVGILGDSLGKLADRLSPVLSLADSPQPEIEKPPADSPLGEDLCQVIVRISIQERRIGVLIDELRI